MKCLIKLALSFLSNFLYFDTKKVVKEISENLGKKIKFF